MRVLVTGGTGFIGAWSAKAIVDAGHDVRLLVRDPGRIESTVGALVVGAPEIVTGDITDESSVAAGLRGCDAVVHCAALVSTSRRQAAAMMATNVRGASNVLGAAARLGLDPIVHVSSIAALFDPRATVLRTDSAVAGGGAGAYGRSKASVEGYARSLQADGAPVVITYPGMVLGPPAGTAFGESAVGVEKLLQYGFTPTSTGAWPIVDVRDLASVHAACLEPGCGPRRFLVGGQFTPVPHVMAALRRLTGRRLPSLAIPGVALRQLGRAVDATTRVLPVDTVFTHSAMEQLTRIRPAEDSAVRDDLGIIYRSIDETLGASIDGLLANGRVTSRQAGRR